MCSVQDGRQQASTGIEIVQLVLFWYFKFNTNLNALHGCFDNELF